MSYRCISLGRSSPIILLVSATTIFCLNPRSTAAQVSEAKPASAEPVAVSPSPMPQGNKLQTTRRDLNIDSLPDSPAPTEQAQEEAQFPATPLAQQPNQLLGLPPAFTRTPLSGSDKLRIYIHKSFGPPALILPAFGTGFQMLNPPSRYPREWKDGSEAFGRLYGYKVADRTSRETAQFLTGFLLHEDPRYQRSTSTNPLRRTFHALAFTVFDKTDSGRTTFAASNFAAAAAGGFVGMGILPDGYNDLTHAEQRMASEFLQIAIGNIATEFEPQWGPWAKKLRIPKILPAWWVPQHSHQP